MARTLLLLLILFSTQVFSQNYKIELQLPLAANQKVQLAYHFLDNIYIKDTCLLDNNGIGVWQGDTLLPQGLYKVYIDKDHHFDFLIGDDQQFSLSNKSYKSFEMKVTGAPETEALVNYLIFIEGLKKRGADLNNQLKSATSEDDKILIRDKMNGLNKEMYSYWESVGEKHPNSFVHQFLVANYVPALDVTTLPLEVQNDDSLLLHARFKYQHEHFWDNFNYTDERLLYTPFYKPKLTTWFNKVLYPAYDSVKPYVYQFLDDVKPSKRIFQFATSFFLNGSINSKIMGMDALFVDIANDYYFTGEAFWASDESMKKIRENVLFMKDNLLGKTAPDLTLESFDGEFYKLHQVESELTAVLIYEPNCSHCKVFVPEFYKDVYLPNKDKGLQVFAIYSMDDKEEWETFLTKHDMFDWMNVWDKDHSSRFKILYDARQTPGVYLLDSDKRIIAKKMDIKGLKQLIGQKLN